MWKSSIHDSDPMAKEDGYTNFGFELDLHTNIRLSDLLVPSERLGEEFLFNF